MSNVNDDYFNGLYKEVWRKLIPEGLTPREIDFMIEYFKLDKKSKVLDLMCGYGRHAIALGRRGIEVVAIDNLGDYTNEIITTAENENLPIKVLNIDVLDFQEKGLFDLAICMGNSLNFFGEGDVSKIFANVSAHLKKGGSFLINSWSIAEIAIKKFRERDTNDIAGFTFENYSKLLYQPTRIETESIITGKDGNSEVKKAIDYIYSIDELEKMLNKADIHLKEIFSIPGKKKFEIGDPRAYIIASKSELV